MKKQLLKFSFVALSLLVVGVNTYAQFTNKRTLKLEGTRQIIALAKRCAGTHSALDDVITVVDEGGNPAAVEHLVGTFSAGAVTSAGKEDYCCIQTPKKILLTHRKKL